MFAPFWKEQYVRINNWFTWFGLQLTYPYEQLCYGQIAYGTGKQQRSSHISCADIRIGHLGRTIGQDRNDRLDVRPDHSLDQLLTRTWAWMRWGSVAQWRQELLGLVLAAHPSLFVLATGLRSGLDPLPRVRLPNRVGQTVANGQHHTQMRGSGGVKNSMLGWW